MFVTQLLILLRCYLGNKYKSVCVNVGECVYVEQRLLLFT